MDPKTIQKKYSIPNNEGTCGLENAEKNKVTFIKYIDYKKFLKKDQGMFVLTSKGIYEKIKEIKGNTYIVVDDPHLAFIEYHNALHKGFMPLNTGNENPITGKNCNIDKTVRFGKNVKIGSNAKILPNTVIGSDVSIGNNTIINSSVSIYDNVSIGNNCIIDSGVVIGGEGFSTVMDKEKKATRLINIGGVIIGNNVEVGSNSAIDRASFSYTKINDNVKIDNLVYISHNVFIGEDTRICGLSCFGGSCKIGKRVWVGLGCTVKDHVDVGDDCKIQLNSVLVNSIPNGTEVSGFYAIPSKGWLMHMKDVYKKHISNKNL